MKVKSTKSWHKLPCAHAQYFDKEADGSPGECASWHGYDRTVTMTFAGEVDDQGWIVPFGELKAVKKFIEYYFDHTAVIPANDPRKEQILAFNETMNPPMFQHRVLPYGVSMEMSSLFIWEQVNPFIYAVTDGRCYVERVDCIEHDSNSAFIEVNEDVASRQGKQQKARNHYLLTKPVWDYKNPSEVLAQYK